MSVFRGFTVSSWKKTHSVLGKKESPLPGTLFILCLCGNITDVALVFCVCSTLATNTCLLHRIHSNPPTA